MSNFNIDLDDTIDEDFFGSLKGSSKLQKLFVDDTLSSEDKHQSLKYQSPKDIATSYSATTNSTLMAKVVTAYKEGDLQGKVGLALIQNQNYTCSIIMYKTKAHILVALNLLPENNLLFRQTKYWQFYDEESTYWSFCFDTPVDEKEFVDKLYSKNITFKKSDEKQKEVTESHLESPNLYNATQKWDDEKLKSESHVIASKETKNSLIKRMAKMGKPLPTLLHSNQQTTTEFSDSSDIEVIKTPFASTQEPSITPRCNKLTSNNIDQQLVPTIVGLNPVASGVYPINPLESQYMQMLLTEQRTQGSELRMNMSKLENKIEKVLDKLGLDDRNESKKRTEKDDELLELEEKLLMLKKENRRLKQNLLENSSEESKENKIKNILHELKEDFNKFNINYQQDLKTLLIDPNDKLKDSHNKLQETQEKLEGILTELDLNIKKNGELKNEISWFNQRENELKQQLKEKETEISKQKHEILDLQKKLQEKNQDTLKNPNDTLVKSIMNNLYMDIADKLNNTNIPHSEQILSLIASSIKEQTLKSLQKNKLNDNLN